MQPRARALILVALLVLFTVLPSSALAQPLQFHPAFALTSLGNGRVSLSWPADVASALVGSTWSPVRITEKGRTPISRTSETTALDTLPAGVAWACYQIEGQHANGVGFVTLTPLCAAPHVANGAAPQNLKITFDTTCSGPAAPGRCPQGWGTAFLSWDSVAGATRYAFVPIGSQRTQVLGSTVRDTTDSTGGQLTCYLVVALHGESVLGYSDVVCGIPPAG